MQGLTFGPTPDQIQSSASRSATVNSPRSRRAMLGDVAKAAASFALASPLVAFSRLGGSASASIPDPDRERLTSWTSKLRAERLASAKVPLGQAAARVGELALGTP